MICLNESATITASGALSYTWNGTPSGSTNTLVITPSQIGNYSLVVAGTGPEGCVNTRTSAVNVDACLGILDAAKVKPAVIPNPFHDYLRIQGSNMTIKIFDMAGREFFSQSGSGDTVVNTSLFHSGLYMIYLYDAEGVLVSKTKVFKE